MLSGGLGARLRAVAMPRPSVWADTLVAAVLAWITRADPDLWGHVRFGLDFLAAGTLPAFDPYSFTQGRPVLEHEWGAEVVMGAAYRIGGMAGLVALKAVLVLATLVIVFAMLDGLASKMRAGSIILVGVGVAWITSTLRPQLWSLLALAAMLALLPHPRRRWLVPLVFAIWANLHGGWIVGLGVLGVWACATHTRHAWSLLAASALATLATPYGVGLWLFLGQTVRLGREIQEWQPLVRAPFVMWVPWIATCALVAVAAWQRRLSPWYLAGCVALAYASLRVLRLVPFFVLVSVVWTAADAPRKSQDRPTVRHMLIAVAVLVTAFLVQGPKAECWSVAGDWMPDVAIGLRAHGTLLVPFNWGEYAIWRWGPGLRVSLDGRRETVYTDAVVRTQELLQMNDRSALPWLSAVQPDVVWYPRAATMVRSALTRQGYRVVAESARSYVLARPGVAVDAWTRAEPQCFPAD